MTPADGEFLAAFEAGTLPLPEWTHAAHVRMAWLYLSARPAAEALAHMRAGIQRYNLAHGNATGYHDTVTCALARLIARRRLLTPPAALPASPQAAGWQGFAAAHPDLCPSLRDALGRHYSPALLASAAARAAWVAPDLAPLPALGDVRSATPDDAPALADIYAPYVLETPASFEVTAPDAAEFERRLRVGSAGFPWLVFVVDGRVVGYAYASAHRARAAYAWSAEVTVYVAAAARGQGIGRMLYGQLLPELAALGYVNAFAGITLPNAASEALHAAAGFALVGVYRRVGFKLGAWRDAGWYQRELAPPPAAPAPPRRAPDR